MTRRPSDSDDADEPLDDWHHGLSPQETLELSEVVLSLRSLAGFVNEGEGLSNSIPRQIDKYTIIDRVGQGGQAIVYLAYDPDAQRMVVIKRYRMGTLAIGNSVAEARALCGIQHASVVQCLGVGQDDESEYLILQPITGQPLVRYWEQYSIDPWQAVRWMIGVAEAVDQLHAIGLVHRDLAPRNLLVTSDQRLVLVDFGMARHYSQASSATAPSHESTNRDDRSLDIAALGRLLEQLLFDHPALKHGRYAAGRTASVFSHAARKQLARIIRRTTDQARTDAIHSAAQFATELSQAMKVQERRTRLTQWGAALTSLSIVASLPASFVWWYTHPEPSAQEPSQQDQDWSMFVRHWLLQDGRLPPLPRLVQQFPLEASLLPEQHDQEGWSMVDDHQKIRLRLSSPLSGEVTVYLLALSSHNAPSLTTYPLLNSDRRPIRLDGNQVHEVELNLERDETWFGFIYIIASNGPISDSWRRTVSSLPLREFGGRWVDTPRNSVSPWQWASEALIPIRVVGSSE